MFTCISYFMQFLYLLSVYHCKKSGVHPFGKQVVNIWKRSIIHAFSDIFRKENPTFSRCFRVGKLEYSFHYPAIFLHSELYENDCFLSVKSTVNRRENTWKPNPHKYPISSTASNDPNGSNDPIVVNTLNIKQAIHWRFHGAGSRAGNNDHDR